MADARMFAKLDLGYFDNPKVAPFLDEHPYVPIMHLRATLYSRQHLTDGKFPIRLVARMASATYCGSQCESECDYCRAVDAGLFERIDERAGMVHDYLEHQQSTLDITRLSNAGKKGAAVRWGGTSDAKGNADGIADGNGTPNAKANAERGEERRGDLPARKRPKTAIPEDWKPTTSHESYASERRLDLPSEAFRFRNHAISVDRRCVNWNSAFTNWLSNAKPAPKQAGNDGQWWT